MGKTWHKKYDNYGGEFKKRKFNDRRNRRRKVHADKTVVMDSYIVPKGDEYEEEENAQLHHNT